MATVKQRLAAAAKKVQAQKDEDAMERVIVTRGMVGICHMQVCTVVNATDEEILAVANRENPSGTSLGWCKVLRDDAPVACDAYPRRRHFLVEC